MRSTSLLLALLCAAPRGGATMRAVRALGASGKPSKCGPPFECIQTTTVPDLKSPPLGAVTVKLISSSVNPSDVDSERQGVGGILGADFVGTVTAVGAGTTKRLKVGDSVWGVTLGTFQEEFFAFEAITGLAPQGPGQNLTALGTIPEVGMTSAECLKETGAPWPKDKNLTVVITSGSGGTGFIGVQLAKAYGAGIVATATSGADNIAFCKSLGADIVTDYKEVDLFSTLANNSVDIVYDNYGGKGTADKAMRTIKPGGTYLLLPGGAGGELSKHPKPGVKQIKFGLMRPSHGTLDSLTAMFEAGALKAHVEHVYDFDHVGGADGAYAKSVSGTVVGKIAVTPWNTGLCRATQPVGKIAEEGTHEDLVSRDGMCKTLVARQLLGGNKDAGAVGETALE